MAPVLLFITGVLAGVIAGFILSRLYQRRGSASDGAVERRLLEERLLQADQGIEQFSRQLENQSAELKAARQESLQAREAAAISRTELEAMARERDALQRSIASNQVLLEQIRTEREAINTRFAETNEQLRSQEGQTQFLEKARIDLLTERDALHARLEQIRTEREALNTRVAETCEQLRSQEIQNQFLEKARTDLVTQFRSLSGQMLDGSREALLKSTKETVSEPFAKEVQQLRQQVEALQKDSNAKLTQLAETTRDLRQRSEDVQGAAQQLTSALRSPNVKGQWGEVNLRRILEFVGLISYCDFDEQVQVETHEGAYRPDCVITIPGTRRLIVDSKAPIESYLDALQASDQTQREAALRDHLKKVRGHIDLLSKKDYAGKLRTMGQVIDAVVLFIPVEGALSMALERDPQLLEYAFSRNIILTFPTSLLAILKGLAMTIQQAEIARNIDEIQGQALELHKRFLIFVDKFNAIGANLSRLNRSFNDAVGSAQARLLPQGRRFAELAGQGGELNMSEAINELVREIQAES